MNTATRIDMTLRAAGIAFDGVVLVNEADHNAHVDFSKESTDKDRDRAASILKSFDWSDKADAAFVEQLQRAGAKDLLDKTDAQAKLFKALASFVTDEIKKAVPDYIPPSQDRIVEAIKGAVDAAPVGAIEVSAKAGDIRSR